MKGSPVNDAIRAGARSGVNVARDSAIALSESEEDTMIRLASAALLATVVAACGGSSLPPARVADTQSSISAAAAVGAEQNPQAALHLKMARDQLRQAQSLLDQGKDEEARLVLERATADADVALMITREAQASASMKKAQGDVESLQSRNQ
jgi:hypothetical protein